MKLSPLSLESGLIRSSSSSLAPNTSYSTSITMVNGSSYLLTGTIGNNKICESFSWDQNSNSVNNAMKFDFGNY